ncbi:MAG: radical SAM protein [Planctomycetes bacterium]|nr:radical SAM protein [Planctomycetota bacterium]
MTELFRQHARTWRDFRFCYPVVSRRSRGLSLGVNLNPDKACNFDCAYCSVDRTAGSGVRGPGSGVDETAIEAELAALLHMAVSGRIWSEEPFDRTPAHLRRLNDVAFSGDGEPTSYAGFPRMLERAGSLIDAAGARATIVIITNATLFHRPAVRDALVALASRPSEVWAKLDAGTDDWYRAVDRSDVPFQRVLGNLRDLGRLRPLVIQSLFCRLHGQMPPQHEIEAWAGRLRWLLDEGARIERVQVYTTARTTAETWATALTEGELSGISVLAARAGMHVEVHC